MDVYHDLLSKLNEISTPPHSVILGDIKPTNIFIKNRDEDLLRGTDGSNLRFGDIGTIDMYSPEYATIPCMLRHRLPTIADSQWSLNMAMLEYFAHGKLGLEEQVTAWRDERTKAVDETLEITQSPKKL